MCLAPILIDNLNRGSTDPIISRLKDTVSHKIPIPCGHCPACLALKQNYIVQRWQCESLDNDLWTGMLSYNNKYLPRYVINGYKHSFADSRDVQLLCRRLRSDNVFGMPFRYWFVSERGSDYHRPHWHFMLSTPKVPGSTLADLHTREKSYHDEILKRWAHNKGSDKYPIYECLLTFYSRNGRRNYDFHYLDPSLTLFGSDDVAFYNSKYLLKDDDYTGRLKSALYFNTSEAAFPHIWRFLKHKYHSSHYLGDVHNPVVHQYIDFCINFSFDNGLPFPCFVNPNTGQTFPLSPYLKKRFCSVQTLLAFRDLHPELYVQDTGIRFDVSVSIDDVRKKYTKHKRVVDLINARDLHADFNIENLSYSSFLDYGDHNKITQLPEVAPDNWESDFFD